MEQAISYFSSNFDHEQEFDSEEIRQTLCEHGVNPLVADSLLMGLVMEQEAETGSNRIPMARLLTRLAEYNEGKKAGSDIDRLPSVHSVDLKEIERKEVVANEPFLVANNFQTATSMGSLNPWASSQLEVTKDTVEAIQMDWISVDWVGVEGGLLTGHATFRIELQAGRHCNRQVKDLALRLVFEFTGHSSLL